MPGQGYVDAVSTAPRKIFIRRLNTVTMAPVGLSKGVVLVMVLVIIHHEIGTQMALTESTTRAS